MLNLIIKILSPETWIYMAEDILCFFLNPLIDRYKPFEDWLWNKSFERVNKAIERDNTLREGREDE